ncbi:MAG TPA: hypothetical protein VF745_13290 [Steroidobacteraceae bacterium]
MRAASSTGLGEHPFVRWEYLDSRGRNLPRSVTVENEQSTVGARMFLGSSGERPHLARKGFLRLQRRTNLYELLTATAISGQEVDFKAICRLHVAYLGSPPLELV